MDNQRLLIWAFFGLMAWITYQTWVQDYGPKPVAQPAEQPALAVDEVVPPQADDDLPQITGPAADARPLPRQGGRRARVTPARTRARLPAHAPQGSIQHGGG